MKISKIGSNLTIILNDGTFLSKSNCDDLFFKEIKDNLEDEDKIKLLMTPKKVELEIEIEEKETLYSDIKSSKVLTSFGNSLYLKSVSELTLPESLAIAIYDAEKAGNTELLQTYINFWTLCCLNPDSRARTNLFWFLNKYGMTISKSGLFVAYRNVEIKSEGNLYDCEMTKVITHEYAKVKFKHKKSPKNYTLYLDDKGNYKSTKSGKVYSPEFQSENYTVEGNLDELYKGLSEEKGTVYTDSYTKTMQITIGKAVSIPRTECDARQDYTCSHGLHVAGKEWLVNSGSFGTTSIMVLVNPADVVAVPPSDNYGKMRTCRYFPIKVIEDKSKLDEYSETFGDGFEDDFMSEILYDGDISTDQSFDYTLDIPEIPEISRSKMLLRLSDISKSLNKVK
jgi:hypothetical protein